jgi:hypothetical protein
MPKAARERVASPPAGTALARAAWNASQAASDWARFGFVIKMGTNVKNGHQKGDDLRMRFPATETWLKG